MCLRALEKMVYQLLDSKEQAELLSASALQPLDVNADGKHSNPVTAYIKGHLTSYCAFITRYLLSACVLLDLLYTFVTTPPIKGLCLIT